MTALRIVQGNSGKAQAKAISAHAKAQRCNSWRRAIQKPNSKQEVTRSSGVSGTKERAESDDDSGQSGKKPEAGVAGADGSCAGKSACGHVDGKHHQNCEGQGGKEHGPNFGERHSNIIGGEWAERCEPEGRGKRRLGLSSSLHQRSSNAASAPITRQLAKSTKTWASMTKMRACVAATAGKRVKNGQECRVTWHAQVHRHGLAGNVHSVFAVFQPIGGQLVVNDGVTGTSRKLEDEVQPQAERLQEAR